MDAPAPLGRSLLVALRDAAIAGLGLAAVALAVNAARPDGLPLVAREPYRILVPCPDGTGKADPVLASDPALQLPGTLLVDARAADDFLSWHPAGARSLPYDFIDPVAAAAVREIAGSGASRVVVYGDGADPDSGRELARELAGKGIRGVTYVEGGAPALKGAAR